MTIIFQPKHDTARPPGFGRRLINWTDTIVDQVEDALLNTTKMDRRLCARISPAEFAGLLTGCAMISIFVYLYQIQAGGPVDFIYYLKDDIVSDFVYGYWLLPVFQGLHQLPFVLAYVLWCLVNLCGAFFAVRVFGGKPALVLISYQFLTCLYYGQISGFLVGMLALAWLGLTHKRWDLAGLGLMMAAAKYQIGVPIGLAMVLYSGITFKRYFRLLPVPLLLFIFSLIIYPSWPVYSVLKSSKMFGYLHLGITFWFFIGAWALLFWIPVFILPLSRTRRLLAFLAATTFAVPYYQHIDLLTLFSLPLGWLPALGYVGVLFPFLDAVAIRLTVIMPFSVYLLVVIPGVIRCFKSFKQRRHQTPA